MIKFMCKSFRAISPKPNSKKACSTSQFDPEPTFTNDDGKRYSITRTARFTMFKGTVRPSFRAEIDARGSLLLRHEPTKSLSGGPNAQRKILNGNRAGRPANSDF